MKLKINPEYKKLLPKLPKNDYESLKDSILKNGLHYSIVVNENGTILDGHNRYEICEELGVNPRHEIKRFGSTLLEKQFVIEANLKRRHLNEFQRIKMGKPLLEIQKELARERQLSTLKKGDVLPVSAKMRGRGKATEKTAEAIGVGARTFEMGLKLLGAAPTEVLNRLEAGKSTISMEYRKIAHNDKIKELEEKIKTLPPTKGGYQVIVIDPPWQHKGDYNANARRVIPPYPTMDTQEIFDITLPADKDCVLWLWTPVKNLHDAFHVVEKWGFKPKTILTWVKDKMGVGAWLRGKTEHCILATKGNPLIRLTNQTTALEAKTRGHSQKPDEFYQLVDTLCIGRKLDYYARKPREGWDVYGTIEGD